MATVFEKIEPVRNICAETADWKMYLHRSLINYEEAKEMDKRQSVQCEKQ